MIHPHTPTHPLPFKHITTILAPLGETQSLYGTNLKTIFLTKTSIKYEFWILLHTSYHKHHFPFSYLHFNIYKTFKILSKIWNSDYGISFHFEKLEVFSIVTHLLLTAPWKFVIFLICPGGLKYNCVANVKRVCNVTLALQHVFQLVSTHFLINMVISIKQRRLVHDLITKNKDWDKLSWL